MRLCRCTAAYSHINCGVAWPNLGALASGFLLGANMYPLRGGLLSVLCTIRTHPPIAPPCCCSGELHSSFALEPHGWNAPS